MAKQFMDMLEEAWKRSATGWTLFAFSASWCLWWLYPDHTPTVGYSIGVLAVVAAVMAALLDNLGALAKFSWIILLFGFLFVETRAIDEDKRKTTKELTDNFAHVSNQAADNFKGILEVEKNNFKDVLDNQQRHFSAMATHLVDQQKQQNQEFNAILTKQQQLFEEQQGFAEFLTGKLLPASDPTPTNSCRTVGPDDVFVALGTNSNIAVANRFPTTILEIHGHSVVSIDRSLAGSLILSIDMRDINSKIIAKLDKNGFVVSKNYELYALRPDRSTIIIEDGFGKEVVKARFINPKAFAIEGVVQYQDKSFPLDLTGFYGSCFAHGSTIISIP
jgi:hypothetical protein